MGKTSDDKEKTEKATGPRGTRLPNDWWPSADLYSWAKLNRPDFNSAQLKDITEDFVDYWTSLPGGKAYKLDWSKTYRNWIRKQPTRRRDWQQYGDVVY